MPRIPDLTTDANRITAFAQLMACTVAVYKDRADKIAEVVGPEGSVIDYQHRPDSWPPSYALIKFPPDRVWLVLAGTTNLGQWIGHIQGTFGSTGVRRGGAVNGQWLSVAVDLAERVGPFIVGGPVRPKLGIFGHSYGGAVGQVMAYGFASNPQLDGVQFMSYGQPKCFTTGLLDPPPEQQVRWRSFQDPVTYTPPSNDEAPISPWVVPATWALGTLEWTHYGAERWLGPDGGSDPLAPVPSPLPDGVSIGPATEHFSLNYWGRLRQLAVRDGISVDGAAALNITGDLLGLPPTQSLVERLPEIVDGPGGLPLRIPSLIQFGSGGSEMAGTYPTVVTPAQPMLVTFFLNGKSSGWTENFVIDVETGDKWFLSRLWASQYAQVRRRALSSSAALVAFRTSQLDVLGDSEREVLDDFGVGPGLSGAAAAEASAAWWLELKDASRVVRSEHPMHGWSVANFPDDLTLGNVQGASARGFGVASTLLTNLRKLLTQDWSPEGGIPPGTVRALIRFTKRDPATITSKDVLSAALDDIGRIVVTVAGDVTDFSPGQTVSLTHKRRRGVTGISGPTTVFKVTAGGAGLVDLTLDKQLRSIPGILQTLSFKLLIKGFVYCKVNAIDFVRVSNRNVGRPTLASVGHRARR